MDNQNPMDPTQATFIHANNDTPTTTTNDSTAPSITENTVPPTTEENVPVSETITNDIVNMGDEEDTTIDQENDVLDTILTDDKEDTKAEEEEIKKLIKTENDRRSTITIPLSSEQTVGEAIDDEYNKRTRAEFVKDRDDPNTTLGAMWNSLNHFNKQRDMMQEILTELKKLNNDNKNLHDTLLAIIPNAKRQDTWSARAKDPSEKILTGVNAVKRVLAQSQGMRRLALWNSGFYVTITALSIGQLYNFLRVAQTEGYIYTRTLGGYFYLYGDIKIKELIVKEFFLRQIIDSTLDGWERMGTDLLKYISIHDYETIVWGFIAMMYRDGYTIRHQCIEPDENKIPCNNIEERKVDFSKLRVFNLDLITKEMIDFMNSKGKVKPEQVLIYQKNIGKKHKPYRFTTKNLATGVTAYWEVKYRNPTVDTYLMYGNEYNSDLFKLLGSDANTTKQEDVIEYMNSNYYALLFPWFDSISELRDIDGNPDDPNNIICTVNNDPYNADDRKNMRIILDTFNGENVQLDVAMHDYVKATKISHIVYQYDKCPKCGKPSANAVDGFIPMDVQTLFFTLCLARHLANQLSE